MNCIFFGDSLTEGDNCDCKFTDFLPLEYKVRNFGVSGTTIGEYSIYPVDGNSLLSQIAKHKDEIRNATHIFIEYGANDVSAVMCGFATVKTVVVSFVKAIDWIRQLNSSAKIIFLSPGSDAIIDEKSYDMCGYLEDEYFANFNFKFPDTLYADYYKDIIHNISNVCDIMYMFDDDMEWGDEYLSDDNIHPNRKGHIRIAHNIENQLVYF